MSRIGSPTAAAICAASSTETRRRLSAKMMPMKSAPASAAAMASATRMQPQILTRVTAPHSFPGLASNRRAADDSADRVCAFTYATASSTRSRMPRRVSRMRRGWNRVAAAPGCRARSSGSRGCDASAARTASRRRSSSASGQTHSMRMAGDPATAARPSQLCFDARPEDRIVEDDGVSRFDERARETEVHLVCGGRRLALGDARRKQRRLDDVLVERHGTDAPGERACKRALAAPRLAVHLYHERHQMRNSRIFSRTSFDVTSASPTSTA